MECIWKTVKTFFDLIKFFTYIRMNFKIRPQPNSPEGAQYVNIP